MTIEVIAHPSLAVSTFCFYHQFLFVIIVKPTIILEHCTHCATKGLKIKL